MAYARLGFLTLCELIASTRWMLGLSKNVLELNASPELQVEYICMFVLFTHLSEENAKPIDRLPIKL